MSVDVRALSCLSISGFFCPTRPSSVFQLNRRRLFTYCCFVTGKFDNVGIATGTPDEMIGRVSALRLQVHSESDNWAILSEVSFILL